MKSVAEEKSSYYREVCKKVKEVKNLVLGGTPTPAIIESKSKKNLKKIITED